MEPAPPSLLDPVTRILAPLTDLLPPAGQDFLNAGGWWLVLAVALLAAVLLVRWLLRSLWRALFGRRADTDFDSDRELLEDLESCPLPVRAPGGRRLMVYHLPVRLRLVIVAPAGKDVDVDATAIEKLLDRVLPGLGALAYEDRPRIRVWPPQLSNQGFAISFRRRVLKAEADGEPSRWILVAGRAQLGRQAILLGLGLWADEPNTIGRLTLQPHQWLDVLRIRSGDG